MKLATAPLRVPFAAGGRLLEPVRADLRREVRRSFGMPAHPPHRIREPGLDGGDGDEEEAVLRLPSESVARHVHADLPAMSIGGLAALLLQTLHPLTMAGVAEHSSYKEHPISRLRRTATFIAATTFGTVAEAQSAIEGVKDVHRRVHGRAPDGRPYSANDPELLTWVHVAGAYCFLTASQLYGPRRLDEEEQDRYYAETAPVARALGAGWVPETRDEVSAYLKRMRPELYAGPQALDARNFLLRGVARRPNDRFVYAVVAAGALDVLPRWAREELEVPTVPLFDMRMTRPVAQAFCGALRWTLQPDSPSAP